MRKFTAKNYIKGYSKVIPVTGATDVFKVECRGGRKPQLRFILAEGVSDISGIYLSFGKTGDEEAITNASLLTLRQEKFIPLSGGEGDYTMKFTNESGTEKKVNLTFVIEYPE